MAFVKYALVYERDGKFFGSKSGIPDTEADVDLNITREHLESFKLVYATKTEIKGSVTGIPAIDDEVIYSAVEEEVEEDTSDEEVTEETKDEEDNIVVEEEEDTTEVTEDNE